MGRLIHFLQGLDTAAAFAVICLGMMTLIGVMPWIRSRLLRIEVTRSVTDGAGDALKAVAGFMVFLVGFSLVQVQVQFRATEEMVLKESNVMRALDRTLFYYGTEDAVEARKLLGVYARSVVSDEWPLLADSLRSQKTEDAFRAFAAKVRQLEATTPRQQAAENELFRYLDEVIDMREARIAASEFGLNPLYWWVIQGLFTILLVLSFFTPASIDRTLANCGMVCAIGMMLTLVLVYESPFSGDISVAPTALRRVIDTFMVR